MASGLHSTTESPEAYLIFDGTNVQSRNLQMSRAWHHVLSYKKKLHTNLFLTAEIYSQHLFDVPVAADSSNFSLINEEVAFTNLPLINAGKGLNYGLEITLEKLFSNAYYFLLNTSLFQSEYTYLGASAYRKTKYSHGFVVNLLGGKEFKFKHNKFLGVNTRMNFSGGKPFIPVLLDESVAANQEIRDEARAYFDQLPLYVGIDFSITYKWIRPKVSHEIKFDIFRLFEQNYTDEIYVPERVARGGGFSPATTRQIQYGEGSTATTILPVLYYKLTI